MKRFVVLDEYGGVYRNLEDNEGLKDILLEEIERDTFENIEDRNIVSNNFKLMKRLVKEKFDWKLIKDELESFGWYVMDLTQLQELLSNYQAYKHGVGAPSYPNDCIEQTLKMIDEEMK